MNNSKKAKIRQDKIRDMLLTQDVVTIHEFCEKLHASEATIRNDLTLLESQHVLKRVLGGAISTEGTPRNTSLHLRTALYNEDKQNIAAYVVAHYIEPGMTIALDAGTTCRFIARALVESKMPVQVITNNFHAASILMKGEQIDLFLAGGRIDRNHGSCHDDNTLDMINSIHCDRFFLSPNGIDSLAQVTSTAIDEHAAKMAFIHQSDEIILVADHSKIGKSAIKVICQLEDASVLITDKKADPNEIQKIEKHGLHVEQV